jgi:hypothetical protein
MNFTREETYGGSAWGCQLLLAACATSPGEPVNHPVHALCGETVPVNEKACPVKEQVVVEQPIAQQREVGSPVWAERHEFAVVERGRDRQRREFGNEVGHVPTPSTADA